MFHSWSELFREYPQKRFRVNSRLKGSLFYREDYSPPPVLWRPSFLPEARKEQEQKGSPLPA
jgi:hypothetical protein